MSKPFTNSNEYAHASLITIKSSNYILMKKFIIHLLPICLLAFLGSCKKQDKVVEPEFEVQLANVAAKVNEPVIFNFKGEPGFLSFYSGEITKDYSYTGGRVVKYQYLLNFDSQILDGAQENQFAVLVSSDFNGTYTLDNVKAANWTDITSKFRIAAHADNRVLVSSGERDITDALVNNKQVYIAFRYIARPETANGKFNLWRVQNLLLQTESDYSGKTSVMAQSAGAWQAVKSANYETNRGYIYTNNITFQGNASNKEVEHEAWVISKAINVKTEEDLGPDLPTAIKSMSDPVMHNYPYTYTKEGIYTATFVAINADVKETKKVIKQVQITVTP